jgi:hypothetical protein
MSGSRMRLRFVAAGLLASTAIPAATAAVANALVAYSSWIECTHGPGIGMSYPLQPADDTVFPPWSYDAVPLVSLYDTRHDSSDGEGRYHDYGYLTQDGYFRVVHSYTDKTDESYDYVNVTVYDKNGKEVGYEYIDYDDYGRYLEAGFYDQNGNPKFYHSYWSDTSAKYDYWYTTDGRTGDIVGSYNYYPLVGYSAKLAQYQDNLLSGLDGAAGPAQSPRSRLPIATVFGDLGGGLGGRGLGGSGLGGNILGGNISNILGGLPALGPIIDISGGSTPTDPPLNYTGAVGNYAIPDVISGLRVDQSWGSAQISAALNQVRGGFYGTSGSGSGADKAPRDLYSAYSAYYAYNYGGYSGYNDYYTRIYSYYNDYYSSYYDYYSGYYDYYSSYYGYYGPASPAASPVGTSPTGSSPGSMYVSPYGIGTALSIDQAAQDVISAYSRYSGLGNTTASPIGTSPTNSSIGGIEPPLGGG